MITTASLIIFGVLCTWCILTTDMTKCKHKPCDCRECREKRRNKL